MLPWLIFEVGTIWFWLLLVAATVVMVACVEYASPGWAVLTVVGFLLVLPRATTTEWLQDVREHPSLIAILLAGYLVAGTVWSIVKWWFYVRKRASKYREVLRLYKARQQLGADVVLDERQMHAALNAGELVGDLGKRPSADKEKTRILTWMIYWPWSLIWTFIDEPIKKAFKVIFNQIRGLYEKISASAYKDIDPAK